VTPYLSYYKKMSTTNIKNIHIAAGGTGGHISPAVSLSEELATNPKINITFWTLKKNLDYPDILSLKAIKNVSVRTYLAPKIPRNPMALFRFIANFRNTFSLINQENKKVKIDACVGFGGFPSFPLVLWARRKKVDYYLCEQNAHWGKITKLMAPKAKKIFLSFLKTTGKASSNELFSGNPICKKFHSFNKKIRLKKVKTIVDIKILIMGGSQGADDLNQLYLAMLADPLLSQASFTVITGAKNFVKIKPLVRTSDKVISFSNDVPTELLSHHVIFSRSGSGSVYEICWAKIPSVFFPYPHATDDHQRKNALALVNLDVAKMIDLRPFEVAVALKELKSTLTPQMLLKMKQAWNQHVLPLDAHKKIAKVILK